MKRLLTATMLALVASTAYADNRLTEKERADGWLLLFDGESLDGWMTSSQNPSLRPVEQRSINPHCCGAYMMIHEKPWANFMLQLDFKISPGCNSGIFLRTWPLKPTPGMDVGYNGLEVAIASNRALCRQCHDQGPEPPYGESAAKRSVTCVRAAVKHR